MKRALAVLIAVALALLASCGEGQDDGAVTRLADNTFGLIDGSEEGEVKYPVLELWDIPVCRCETLVTNTPHGTRVQVLAKKANCSPVQYEVEILEGEKAGIRGWVSEGFLRFEEDGTATPD